MADPIPPTVNIVIGSTGAIPTPPATIRSQLLAYLQQLDPEYTVLPGLLIEDILSTDVAAVAECDSAAIELINSLGPNTANAYILYKLGAIYGVPPGLGSNTSVYVVFSGPAGYVIPAGFIVGDGTYQYIVQDGGSIGAGGQSQPLYSVASQGGTWPVVANSVTTTITSIPSSFDVTVTNPLPGTSGAQAQTVAQYRAQVLQAGLATATGMATLLKTLLGNVPGVQPNLISVIQVDGGGWEVIVGGGDPYQVAYAIYTALFDINTLVGSSINITGITNANPGVVTTDLAHGLVTGQDNVHIAGVLGVAGVNGGPYTVTVPTPYTFSFGVDTTDGGAYVSGGVVTPNNRNVVVDLIDYPNIYRVPFVIPPAQTLLVNLLYKTDAPNFISQEAVATFGAPAIAAYMNALAPGQPINLGQAAAAFVQSISGVLAGMYVSGLAWTITINGVVTDPEEGTFLVFGDDESYFTTNAASVTISQG
jgi:hypothetical protein